MRAHVHLSAAQAILLSFAAMITVGTALLALPMASRSGASVGWLDALFTATSANCVTGLVVVTTASHWTLFGQLVILALIQLGGIGFITVVTGGLIVLRRRISLRQRLTIQTSFNQANIGGMVKLVGRVLRYTLLIEGVGAVGLTLAFWREYPLGRAAWYGVFHAISAFCNAGFDVLGANSLAPYRDDPLVTGIVMLLIVLGGLGFTVLTELRNLVRPNPRRWGKRLRHLSLHTKLVLVTTAGLLVGGTLLFALLEWHNPATLGPASAGHKWWASAFESVTLRTAGFFSIDQGGLSDISKLAASALMFIGGSPASTAGGIKTISLAVMAVAVLAAIRGSNRLTVFRRQLPLAALQKALAITGTLAGLITVAVLILHFTEPGSPALDLLFEATSATGTVGLTTGLTPSLSAAGKLVITLCMFIGRLSPLTLAVALTGRMAANPDLLAYPDETIISG